MMAVWIVVFIVTHVSRLVVRMHRRQGPGEKRFAGDGQQRGAAADLRKDLARTECGESESVGKPWETRGEAMKIREKCGKNEEIHDTKWRVHGFKPNKSMTSPTKMEINTRISVSLTQFDQE